MNNKSTFIFIIVAISISFGLGSSFGTGRVICPVCPPEHVDFSLFWETWKTLEEEYVGSSELDIQQMIYGAISGMINSINDPYTYFLDPSDSKIFSEEFAGKFGGVGMEIGIREGELRVIAPLEGTPAQKAGLRSGDVIKKVDGKPIVDVSVQEAVKLIRGKEGTEVVLTVFRESWEAEKDIKIIRDVIEVPSLDWELKEGNIAHIRIYNFNQKAKDDFNKVGREILNSSAERIILDLRNNPGGYLGVAQSISGWFLEKGAVVTIEDFGDEREKKEYKADGPGALSDYFVICLINKGSASGSEILAGALRDNKKILLIGETSFGKGSVQQLIPLRDGSSLKVTVAKWLTPEGISIDGIGLEPDIIVEMSEEDYQEGKDRQLEKALEVIKNF
jgi:carboxyl-terminal processing protease